MRWNGGPPKSTQRQETTADRVNRVHDEDVLRWNRTVSEADAIAYARVAGYGTPCLPASQAGPAISAEPCAAAADYMSTLSADTRHAISKHCSQLSRHQQLLLEGQERLAYVQAQVKEMKARMPPPPPPPPPPPLQQQQRTKGKAKRLQGPSVSVVPLKEPTCWASCFGLTPLPPPPPPLLVPPPAVIPLPPPAYFRDVVAARRAAAQPTEVTQDEQQASGTERLGPPADDAPSVTQPVSASVGGASDTAASPAHATHHLGRRKPPEGSAAESGVSGGGAVLPGQLHSSGGALQATRREEDLQGSGLGPTPAAMQAPVQPNPPGSPQSLVRPLASLPAGPNGAARGAAAGSGPRKVALPPMRPPPVANRSSALSGHGSGAPLPPAGQPRPHAAVTAPSLAFDLQRYSDPASVRRITLIQAAQRGRIARKQVAAMRSETVEPAGVFAGPVVASTSSAMPTELASQHPEAPTHSALGAGADPVLERYRDPESLRKIVTIQAAQRGRTARREAAARRAAAGAQEHAAGSHLTGGLPQLGRSAFGRIP